MSNQFSANDLRHIIALQQREIRGNNERLKGVEELTRLLNESDEKRQNLQTKLDNCENALKRAEARIAYLNKKLGIDSQSTFGIDVVSPWISRKAFDAVTKENIRLKEALDVAIVNAKSTSATNATSNKEQEKIVEEKDKVIAEQETKIQELLAKNEESSKIISELSTEIVKTNEAKQKAEHEFTEVKKMMKDSKCQNQKLKKTNETIEHELSETAKKCSDFQKKCAGFSDQVVSLNSKQQESEEEISSLKRACENLRAQLAEKEAMMVMMRDSLKAYEDDLRREQEQKTSIRERLRSMQQQNVRLGHEIQIHRATIRHLRSENRTPLLVAGTNRQGSGAAFSPTLFRCPLCFRIVPLHLIDNHIKDCIDHENSSIKNYNTGAL